MKYNNIQAKKNPIIPSLGVCDPHIHVFDGIAYLYASHDKVRDATTYHMENWHIWSSSDLVNWKFECEISPKDFFMGPSSDCWAVDVAYRNDTYYLYFSDGNRRTGVAISSSPSGPFVDALGYPLLDGTLTPTAEYDPAIFIDIDNTPYIIFGGPSWAYGEGSGYFIAKLHDDMISLAESPRRLEVNHEADDKASLHVYNGRYYLSWASFYAISDSVYGPYTYIGNFGASADHGSFFEKDGQWFNAFTIFDPSHFHRATGLCFIHYADDGRIYTDRLICEYGVGHYDGRWHAIDAIWYMQSKGIKKSENPRFSFDVSFSVDGGWIRFPNISHIPKNPLITCYAAMKGEEPCTLEVREESFNGPLRAIITISPTRTMQWMGYRTFSAPMEGIQSNEATLCFVFRSKTESVLNLTWFSLSDNE